MQALKFTVIFMGMLIVAGLAMLAYGIVSKAGRLAGGGNGEPFAVEGPALPPGGGISDMAVGDGRAVLRVRGREGEERLMVFETDTGRHLGTIVLPAGR